MPHEVQRAQRQREEELLPASGAESSDWAFRPARSAADRRGRARSSCEWHVERALPLSSRDLDAKFEPSLAPAAYDNSRPYVAHRAIVCRAGATRRARSGVLEPQATLLPRLRCHACCPRATRIQSGAVVVDRPRRLAQVDAPARPTWSACSRATSCAATTAYLLTGRPSRRSPDW